jgi:hypothetical protein
MLKLNVRGHEHELEHEHWHWHEPEHFLDAV